MNYDFAKLISSPAVQNRLSEYVQRGDTNPYKVDLDLTTACNYRCPHCGDLAQGRLNRGGMNWTVFGRLLEGLTALDVHEVTLIGGGEPTMSLIFDAAVENLGASGLHLGLVTNGSLLYPARRSLLARYCSWVRVSLDAATSDTYERLHRPGDSTGFQEIVDTLRAFRSEYSGELGISFVVMNSNVQEIYGAALLAKSIGLNSIRYRLMNHPRTDAPVPIRDLDALDCQSERALSLASSSFIVSFGETLNEVKTNGGDYQPKAYTRCAAQAFAPVVSGEGLVYLCSKWRGDAWACIGDLNVASFVDIWHGEQRAEVLRRLNPSVQCSNVYCHAHVQNSLLAGK